MRRRALAPRLAPRALLLALVFGALLSTGLGPLGRATTVRASTAGTITSDLFTWINRARADRGLGALHADSRLASVASQRAAKLASLNQLSHDAAGCLSCQLAASGVSYNLMGEVLASNNYPWGPTSASVVFSSWSNSPAHWSILMGASMDSIGIGVSLSSNGTTYASAVLIDAPGVTAVRPKAPVHVATVKQPRPPAPPAPAPVTAPEPSYVHREGSVRLGRIPC